MYGLFVGLPFPLSCFYIIHQICFHFNFYNLTTPTFRSNAVRPKLSAASEDCWDPHHLGISTKFSFASAHLLNTFGTQLTSTRGKPTLIWHLNFIFGHFPSPQAWLCAYTAKKEWTAHTNLVHQPNLQLILSYVFMVSCAIAQKLTPSRYFNFVCGWSSTMTWFV